MKTTFLPTVLSVCLLTANIWAAAFPAPVVPANVGVNIHIYGSQPDYLQKLNLLQETGAGVVHIDLRWNRVERSQGQYDFSGYDNIVAACEARGIRIHATLNCEGISNPLYGYDDKDPQIKYGVDDAKYFGTNSFRNGFTAFVMAMVNRYKGKKITWEVWSEPNLSFWPGYDANQYMALLNQVLPQIRTKDPTATIVGPSLGAVNVGGNYPAYDDFLKTCMDYGNTHAGQKGLLSLVDGVSVHPYRWGVNWNPETIVDQKSREFMNYADLRALIDQYAGGSKVQIISGNWGYTLQHPGVGTLQTQADYAARLMLVNFSQGIPLSDLYEFGDDGTNPTDGEHHFGLVNFELSPKPAFFAIKNLTSTLQGTTFNRKLTDSNSNDWLTVFRSTTTGREILAAWTTGTAGVSTVPGWGTHLLNGTPLYLGQLQAWAGGNGNWSSHSWGNGSAWVDGGQATFSNADQVITVDGVPKISGIQFEANNVTLSGGSLNFTSGGGSIYTAGGNATIRSVVAGGGDPASGTCSNTVASTFCLRKSGAGTLTLSGSNAFVGGVLVGQGTLIISGTIRSATAISLGGTLLQNSSTPLTNSIAFADGATFGGTGTYTGNLSPGGGHLSPGSGGVGVFTQEGNLTLSSTSVLDYDFGTTAGSCDRWSFSGSGRSIVLDGTLNIHVAGPVAEGRYTIISGATSVTDSGLKFGDVPANRKWSYEVLKNGGLYDVVVIAVGATATKGQ